MSLFTKFIGNNCFKPFYTVLILAMTIISAPMSSIFKYITFIYVFN